MSLIVFFALLLVIPSSLPAAQAKPRQQVDLSAGPGVSQADWDKTVAAAEEEGQVVIYSYPGATRLPIDAGVFQKKFPKIKVVVVLGDAVQRILSERRAGKYLADIYMGGPTTGVDLALAKALAPMRDAMILPEVLDESNWWGGKHYYTDPEKKYAFSYIGRPGYSDTTYNPTLVNPREFQSLRDFVNPKWKGKISARDIRTPGQGQTTIRMFYYHPNLGPEFVRRLFGEMDVALFRDPRQGVDWLVSGRLPLCFFCPNSEVGRAQRQGLPIELFDLKEGANISSASGNMGFVSKAPHPNAGKVFVNWLLSRAGQMVVQAEYAKAMTGASNSRRIDIPKDMIPAADRLHDGIDYMSVETLPLEPVMKVFNEALAKAGR